MDEMTDADIDRKINEWVEANRTEWLAWLQTLSEEQKSNRALMAAMRLAFLAGMDAEKEKR